MPLISWRSCFAASLLLNSQATAFTGSKYALSFEYSGTNFFDGWDFYSGRDPTGGLVTYYSRSSAQLTGLISSPESGPAYMGVNYVDKIPFNNQTGQGNGAGRPSVRIASKQAFTHGLFIGDFAHIPAGVCGTWPAFWTLGPNWPYTGEIDIMEGVNQNTNNIMSLHTNETCLIQGNSSVMTGTLGNTNCAYYPDYNVGCGVIDTSPKSFGKGFNQAGGGVYAMQWTSEYIRIWQWSRADIPADVNGAEPDPSGWGLPSAQLAVGNCSVDQHFQSHKIIFDTTFCGEYAGNPYVWNTTDANSCAASTGLSTCDNFVANNPAAFKDAYWSVNYVRVFQLLDPADDSRTVPYIASQQPTNTATNTYTASNPVATLNLDADSLCPQYNFSIISDGRYQYEIACDFDPPGPDILGTPYSGFRANSLADCIKGCTYMNENNGTNTCGGVSHYAAINFCYFKKYIDGNIKYRPGYNEIRLIYYGYPQITDDPRSVADSTLTSVFVETIPTPQTYRPSTIANTSGVTTTTTMTSTFTSTIQITSSIAAPPMGFNSSSTSKSIPANYSETITSGYLDSTTTLPDVGSNTTTTTVSDSTISTTSAGDLSATPLTTSTASSTESDTAPNLMSSTMPVAIPSPTSVTTSDEVSDTTSSAPSSVTSTDPSATHSDFYITFNVNIQARRILKRQIQYLAFDIDGKSILVSDQSDATKFQLDSDGMLRSGDLYVAVDSSMQPPRFLVTDIMPDTPAVVDIDEDGNVKVQGVDEYCLTSDGELAVSTDSQDLPNDCAVVSPELLASADDSPTTSTSDMETTMLSSTSMEGPSVTVTTTEEIGNSPPDPDDSTSREKSASSSTTVSSSSSMTSTSSTPTATMRTINDSTYAGCFGVPASAASLAGISAPFTDAAMTNDECTKHCGEQNAYYAGTYDTRCFCGTSQSLYAQLLDYPDASCNSPCPGANRDICGGDVGFQSAIPTTTTSNMGKRAMLKQRQSAIFLISLYNNTLLLGSSGGGDVPTTSDSATAGSTTTGLGTNTEADTVTNKPTSTTLAFPPDSISYNVTGTNTATVISTTYVDVCHVCPGGLTTMSTTVTIPHCGCTASYHAGLGTSVNVPSPVVPMITTTKACVCGHEGAASTVTVTIPCKSSIAQLSSQLVSMPTASSPASQSGNMGAMQSPAPAEAVAGVGSVSLTNDEPVTSTPGTAAAASNNLNEADDVAAPNSDEEDHYDDDNDDVDCKEDDCEPETNDVSLTAAAGGSVPAETPSAAPASPLTPAVASNTAIPTGVSNYTVQVYPVASTSTTDSGPIASFKSDASSLVRNEIFAFMEGRFFFSLIVGAALGLLVATW